MKLGHLNWRRKWQPTPVFLPGESQGWGSLVGCHPWGCTELDMTEVTEHARKHANQHIKVLLLLLLLLSRFNRVRLCATP